MWIVENKGGIVIILEESKHHPEKGRVRAETVKDYWSAKHFIDYVRHYKQVHIVFRRELSKGF